MNWLLENWISLLALTISIGALIFTYKQSLLASKEAHQHIKPVLKTYFDKPIEKNPIFVIANEGNIPIVSVSVGNRTFAFDKKEEKIAIAAESSKVFSPGAIFRESLKPTEHEDMELLKINPRDDLITIYEFRIKYFREKDMKEYERKEYFFIDGSNTVSHTDFLNNKYYRLIMSEVINYKFPEKKKTPGSLREFIEATTDKE